jgi:hypothetical protein
VLRIVNVVGAAAIDAFVVEGELLGSAAQVGDEADTVVTPEPTPEPTAEPLPEGPTFTVEGMTTVESDDAAVVRSAEWQPMSRPEGASGGQYLMNIAADQTLSLTFSGTRVEVVYVSGPSFNDFVVQVDGVDYPAVSTNAVEYEFGNRFAVEALAEGTHTIVVTGSGVVGIDAFLVLPTDAPGEEPVPVEPEPVVTEEPTAEPTETALALPIYLDLNAGVDDWSATAGWLWTPEAAFGEAGAGWALTSGALAEESAQWTTPIDLRLVAQPIQLMFHSWYQGMGTALVQASVDGVNWLPVAAVPMSSEWLVIEADLSAYVGQVIQLRFTWQAPSTPGNTGRADTWLLDDVLIAPVAAVTPTDVPTLPPTEGPTLPAELPTVEPVVTEEPTAEPTAAPTELPTETPTEAPASSGNQPNG